MEVLKKFAKTKNFKTLNQYISSGKFSHAILLCSHDSFSSFNMAKLLALSIFQNASIDLSSKDAIQINEQTHADVKFLPEKETFLVGDADKLQEESYLKPVSNDKKIFIIKNIDKSTIQAQNKLLKIIEEPPKNVIYIFTCENLELVLQTIKSRVQKFVLEPFTIEEISLFLDDNENKSNVLLISNGNIGKAIEYSKDQNIFNTYDLIKDIVLNLKSSKNVLSYSSKLAENKIYFVFAISVLEEVFRDILVFKQGKIDLVIHKDLVAKIEKEYSVKAILEIIKRINNTKKEFDANVSVNLLSDNLLMGILEEKYLWK